MIMKAKIEGVGRGPANLLLYFDYYFDLWICFPTCQHNTYETKQS